MCTLGSDTVAANQEGEGHMARAMTGVGPAGTHNVSLAAINGLLNARRTCAYPLLVYTETLDTPMKLPSQPSILPTVFHYLYTHACPSMLTRTHMDAELYRVLPLSHAEL